MLHVLLIVLTLSSLPTKEQRSTEERHGCDAIKGEPIDLSTRTTRPVPGIEPPILLRNARPIVPEELTNAGMIGTTRLKLLISQSGCVERVTVVKSSHRLFDEAAITAAKRWRYIPAKRNGTPVPAYVVAALGYEPAKR